jgi:hypothetical protein
MRFSEIDRKVFFQKVFRPFQTENLTSFFRIKTFVFSGQSGFNSREVGMARHNRDGHGVDQRGYQYVIGFQPDWLRYVKVTRDLETGRQSTKTLYKNPADIREAEPGNRVRTRVTSEEQDLEFEVTIADPKRAVRRIRVAYELPGRDGRREEEIEFSLEGLLPGD